jgi:hypothetical protein
MKPRLHQHTSFPVADIKRTLDAMSWVKVSDDLYPDSIWTLMAM